MAKEPISQSTCRERENNYYRAKEDKGSWINFCPDNLYSPRFLQRMGMEWLRENRRREGVTEINIGERNILGEGKGERREMARCRLHMFPI